jgi:uncharacterized protein YlxP (DUF503 family)
MGAYVALLLVHLHFPEARSLKAKRSELQSVKAQLHGRHGLTVAEVAHQDAWQRSTLAAALTGGSAGALETSVERVERWLDGRFPQGVRIERTLHSFEDVLGLG